MKLFLAGVSLIVVLMLVAGIAVAYVAYQAKKRVTAMQQALKNDNLAGAVGALEGKTEDAPQPLPSWKPAPPELAGSAAGKVPLRTSLRLVEVGSEALRGDYESIFVYDSVTDQSVHIHGSEQFPNGNNGPLSMLEGDSGKSKAQGPMKIECSRTQLRVDMDHATESDGYFCVNGRDERHPGTVSMGPSKKTLLELRSTGTSQFTTHEDPLKATFTSFKKAMEGSQSASDDFLKNILSMAPGAGGAPKQTPPIHCTLIRQGDSDVAFPVLINDQQTDLPAMHVVCKTDDNPEYSNMYVLDDPENPLVLAGIDSDGHRGQVVKIYWNNSDAATGGNGAGGAGSGAGGGNSNSDAERLAQELEKTGRAKVYDIYFDFRSNVLRPESKKVLDEIDQVMREHPDWKLRVEGHTDNIGGHSFNMDLSSRRADAVKQALVTKYKIDANRFSTAGMGDSQPVATNETVEGRALNRRVELVKQ